MINSSVEFRHDGNLFEIYYKYDPKDKYIEIEKAELIGQDLFAALNTLHMSDNEVEELFMNLITTTEWLMDKVTDRIIDIESEREYYGTN
jgi:hypothetical protein